MTKSFTLKDVETWIDSIQANIESLQAQLVGLQAIKKQILLDSLPSLPPLPTENSGVENTDAASSGTLLDVCLATLKGDPGVWYTTTRLAEKIVELGYRDEDKSSLAPKITTSLKKYRTDPPVGFEVKQDGNKYLFRAKH
jgi:hypothetical protein